MLLSLVVPTYNVEKFIGNCLQSLLNQDIPFNDYEIIVINDGSTDNSLSIASDYAKKNKNIHVHTQENQGLSAARNKGIVLAKGKYIYFIDSDDYVSANCLGYILRLLETHQLDVLCIRHKKVPVLNNYEANNIHTIDNEKIEVVDGISYIAQNNYLNNAWWYFINRDFLMTTKLIFPIERFVEDANFTANLFSYSKRMASSSIDFYRYYIRPNSIMRTKTAAHNFKMISDYEKNVYDFDAQLKRLENVDHPKISECRARLRTRQQSFVFFMLVRMTKSDIKISKIKEKLVELKKINAYPLDDFLGKDYNGFNYLFMSFIFNSKYLISPTIKIYRGFRKLV